MNESPENSEPVIKASALRKLFGDLVAVDGVDFEIRPGECFGFLGPNGAGKTTTMKMMQGLASRSGGEMSVFGMDPETTGRKIRKIIGVVPQEDNLDPDLTVEKNLIVYGRYFGIPTKVASARADELLDFVQLTQKRKVRIPDLSGGMKRRLVIARALLHSPKALILDEPTTGLDPQARHLIWQKLRGLKMQGVTQVLTTHYMEEASQLCDRIVIMDEGRILDEGSPAELIEKHVGHEVVEIRRPQLLPTETLAILADGPWHREVAGDTWYFFPADAGETGDILEVLHRSHRSELLHRSAGLEDVFLKLTGRDLHE